MSLQAGGITEEWSVVVAGEDEEGHRGLALVHELTKGRWGAAVEAFGKVVHADLVVGRRG
ncbi:hypothetical protein AB0D10_06035 [Kitasatospora sp. NPDC048545]|uniref:hypothetical protein n=1 Tax=Kitasatospora sp. NPDC048545 TaxID=3157208 RepID=UPI003408E225